MVEGKSKREKDAEKRARWETLTVEQHVRFYEEQGMERREAMKQAAKDRGVSRRDVYQALLGEEK